MRSSKDLLFILVVVAVIGFFFYAFAQSQDKYPGSLVCGWPEDSSIYCTQCLKGEWEVVGLYPDPVCINIPVSDYGAVCTDGSQCESGRCIEEDVHGMGACDKAGLRVGCYVFIENGTRKTVCQD